MSQLARQFGDDALGNDHRAVGGYLFADRSFDDVALKPQLTAGYAYLSGNDPATADNEGWNPLFSRYPWMSELMIFTYVPERDIAYWTNLQLYRVAARLNLAPATNLQLNYNYLRANESLAGPVFGPGRGRGHLPQATLSHRFNPNLDALAMVEYLLPGSFYHPDADEAVFFRWQLQYRV